MFGKTVDSRKTLSYGRYGRETGMSSIYEQPGNFSRQEQEMVIPLGLQFESALSYDNVTDDARLVFSATLGDIDEVREYLAKGIDIGAANYGAVVGAARNGNLDVLELLLSEREVPVAALKEAREFAQEKHETITVAFLDKAIKNKSTAASSVNPQP